MTENKEKAPDRAWLEAKETIRKLMAGKWSKRQCRQVVEAICGKDGAKQVWLAIKRDVPIMIYQQELTGDGTVLYWVLKTLGARQVRGYHMSVGRDGFAEGVFCTVFLTDHSKCDSNIPKAGESSEILKQ